MSLHESPRDTPRFTSQDDNARLLLAQIYREQVATGWRSALFSELCAHASIPGDQRARLLDQLLRERYLTQGSHGLVRLTEAGTLLATALRP